MPGRNAPGFYRLSGAIAGLLGVGASLTSIPLFLYLPPFRRFYRQAGIQSLVSSGNVQFARRLHL